MRRQYENFSLSLEASEDRFARFPSPFQKGWMLGRAFREFADDLEHLDVPVSLWQPTRASRSCRARGVAHGRLYRAQTTAAETRGAQLSTRA